MSESLTITLPDGSQKSVSEGSSPLDIAKSIGPRLADDAVVARVDGQLWDLTRPFENDAQLEILTSKNPEALQVYRHSTAHLLAAAVLELFPETKLGIGPPIDTGFYYDFQRETPFTPEDLEKIEANMWEIQAKSLPYERVHDAQGRWAEEILGRLDEARVDRRARGRSLLRIHAGAAFHRLLPRAARAIDRADSKRSSCSRSRARIGRATSTTRACSASTALRFSTRRIWTSIYSGWRKPRSAIIASSARSWICSASRSSPDPGLIFFHPKGGRIRKIIEDWMRDQYLTRGYSLVYTPHVMRARSVEDFRARQFL